MFQRALNQKLLSRLKEPRRFIQVLAGPRQVGKTTSVLQVMEAVSLPYHYVSADSPMLQEPAWIEEQEGKKPAPGGESLRWEKGNGSLFKNLFCPWRLSLNLINLKI